MAPDNSWRPGRETSSYKQMLLLLEVEMFSPQSAPFSQAKTIPHGDPTLPQRNKDVPVLCVPETVCSFRHAQPRGRADGHVIAKLEDKVGLVRAFRLWRKALGCLTEDEADTALVPAPGWAAFSVPSCRFRTRRRGQGQRSPESTQVGWNRGAPPGPASGRAGACILAACVCFLLQADPSLRSSPARPPHWLSNSH